MAKLVRKKLEATTSAGNPSDPWTDFRDVEILDLRFEFSFRHTLGKLSRFFLMLENHRLFATQCPLCKSVWMPPRAVCGNDLTITQWVELSGRGALAVASATPYSSGDEKGRQVFGYVALDGASTLLFHRIRNVEPKALVAGLPMKAVWGTEPVDHPMQLFWFEPE